jgi:hypothetical protein
VTSDRHIHELSVQLGGTGWTDADLTQITGAPLVMPIGGMIRPEDVTPRLQWYGIEICLSHSATVALTTGTGATGQILGLVGTALGTLGPVGGIVGVIVAGLGTYFALSALLIQAFDKNNGVCLHLTWLQIGFGNFSLWTPTSR